MCIEEGNPLPAKRKKKLQTQLPRDDKHGKHFNEQTF